MCTRAHTHTRCRGEEELVKVQIHFRFCSTKKQTDEVLLLQSELLILVSHNSYCEPSQLKERDGKRERSASHQNIYLILFTFTDSCFRSLGRCCDHTVSLFVCLPWYCAQFLFEMVMIRIQKSVSKTIHTVCWTNFGCVLYGVFFFLRKQKGNTIQHYNYSLSQRKNRWIVDASNNSKHKWTM